MQSDLAEKALEQDLKADGDEQEAVSPSDPDLRTAAGEAWDTMKTDNKEGFVRAFEAAVRIGNARGSRG